MSSTDTAPPPSADAVPFLSELCNIIGMPRPGPATADVCSNDGQTLVGQDAFNLDANNSGGGGGVQSQIEPEEALLLLSMKPYEEGRVSLGYAAAMAGYTKRTYMELLSKRGVPVVDYPPEELDRELEILDRLGAGPSSSLSWEADA